MASKIKLRTVRIKLFLINIYPQQRYSNEAERVNQDIYDSFKMKKNFSLNDLYTHYFSSLRFKNPHLYKRALPTLAVVELFDEAIPRGVLVKITITTVWPTVSSRVCIINHHHRGLQLSNRAVSTQHARHCIRPHILIAKSRAFSLFVQIQEFFIYTEERCTDNKIRLNDCSDDPVIADRPYTAHSWRR